MSHISRNVLTATLACAAATLLSSAQAQNNFLDNGNVSALSKAASIHDLAPDTMTFLGAGPPDGG